MLVWDTAVSFALSGDTVAAWVRRVAKEKEEHVSYGMILVSLG